jgi:hypothetical protein
MADMKRLSIQLRTAELKANRLYDIAFELADSQPGTEANANAEKAWSDAEDAANEIRQKLADEIQRVTSGMIDSKTAWAMTYKPKLYDLIEKFA